MITLQSNLINAVLLKLNEQANKYADELSKSWDDSESNPRDNKNTIIQLLGIFFWNQLKTTNDKEKLKFQEKTKNKFLFKTENCESKNLRNVLFEIVDYYSSSQDIFTKGCENPLIKRALDYIYNNCDKKISLDILSEQFHVSRSYLSTLIAQNTGTNLPNILNTFRIEKSILLLTNTDKSITEISKSVGFKSDSYFCQQFKNIKKVTPKKFRTITKRGLY